MTMITALLSRRSICLLLIGVLVSTQLAIAAYACAGVSRAMLRAEQVPAGSAMAMTRADAADPVGSDPRDAANPHRGMDSGCSRLDPALPNLCVAHQQYGQQSADHSPAPTVTPAVLISLYTLPPPAESAAARAGSAARAGDAPAAAVDPPHAVLHCCLRI